MMQTTKFLFSESWDEHTRIFTGEWWRISDIRRTEDLKLAVLPESVAVMKVAWGQRPYLNPSTLTLIKVRKKEIAERVCPVFFFLPRITSKAPLESLQFIHSFMLSFDKYYIVPTSCQALFYMPEAQGKWGKQHPCLCDRPMSSSLEVKPPVVEAHHNRIRTLISPTCAFA